MITPIPGTVRMLVGPNGCGKTYALSNLEGFRPLDQSLDDALLLVENARAERDRRYAKTSIRLDGEFGKFVVQGGRTRDEVLAWHETKQRELAAILAEFKPEALLSILDEVGVSLINVDSKPKVISQRDASWQLSSGQERAVKIIFAVAFGTAKTVILDDPTQGMHPELSRALGEWMVKEATIHDLAIIGATHDPELGAAIGRDNLTNI
jgi:ABC-type cobalamin/Fe3+-siderophores transport system ATPase subunit